MFRGEFHICFLMLEHYQRYLISLNVEGLSMYFDVYSYKSKPNRFFVCVNKPILRVFLTQNGVAFMEI